MKNNQIGIYVHIPFCKQKCYYCDFVSYSNRNNFMEKYVQALEKEIQLQEIKSEITTIYIGGGTPSYIDAKFIKEILEEIRNKKVFREAEITIEVNPGTVTLEKLKEYKEGDKVGNIYIYINDELLATKDIYVSKDIEKNKKSFWQKIWEVIKFW